MHSLPPLICSGAYRNHDDLHQTLPARACGGIGQAINTAHQIAPGQAGGSAKPGRTVRSAGSGGRDRHERRTVTGRYTRSGQTHRRSRQTRSLRRNQRQHIARDRRDWRGLHFAGGTDQECEGSGFVDEVGVMRKDCPPKTSNRRLRSAV